MLDMSPEEKTEVAAPAPKIVPKYKRDLKKKKTPSKQDRSLRAPEQEPTETSHSRA